jgi:hypothetical protein
MNVDQTAAETDSAQKIYSIGSAGFIATAGFKMVCEFHQTRAPELTRELRTADIEKIAEALAGESLPVLLELLLTLSVVYDSARFEHMRQRLSGESLLASFTLVGRNAQKAAGFVTVHFQVVMGQIACQKVSHFDGVRWLSITHGDPSLQLEKLAQNDTAMHGEPIAAVRSILQDVKSRSALIGGPGQIAIVDSKGARWVNRPPEGGAITPQIDISNMRFSIATITASIEISAAMAISCQGSISCTTFTCSGLDVDAGGNLSATSLAVSGSMAGRDVTCGNSLTVDTGSVTVNGHAGITATFQDKAGNTHNVVGGIITS